MDILIDVGAFESLIGIASEENYRFRERSVFADSNNPIIKRIVISTLADINKTRYFGNAAMRFKNVLNVQNFMAEKDYNSYSKLIGKKLQELPIKLEETGLVLVVSNHYSINDKQNLQNTLFQTLKVPRIAFLPHTASILSELEIIAFKSSSANI